MSEGVRAASRMHSLRKSARAREAERQLAELRDIERREAKERGYWGSGRQYCMKICLKIWHVRQSNW